MKLTDAYRKVKDLPENKKLFLVECLDFGEFWGFAFCDRCPTEENPVGGIGFDTVDKATGQISYFYPTDNLKLFDKAVGVSIEALMD